MADGTKIEWTDATWNIINGCSVVSPGCANCYAMRLAGTRLKHHPSRAGLTVDSKTGPVWTGETRLNEPVLLDPVRWRRPRKVFVCAHGDLFHEKVPDEWLNRIFAVMLLSAQHTFQVLTKRPERMREYLTTPGRHTMILVAAAEIEGKVVFDPVKHPWPMPNVWLGTSVEDQRRADERIPILLATPAAVRWLSCEPLLGPVNLEPWLPADPFVVDDTCDACGERHHGRCDGAAIDWVVVGGESGPGSRAMHPNWARSLRDQCAAAGVPMMFKQWGNWTSDSFAASDSSEGGWLSPDGTLLENASDVQESRSEKPCLLVFRTTKRAAGRLLDGTEHNGYPA